MDGENVEVVAAGEEYSSTFDEGWGDGTEVADIGAVNGAVAGAEDGTAAEGGEAAVPEVGGESGGGPDAVPETTEEAGGESGGEAGGDGGAAESFEINVGGAKRSVSREEVVRLAQAGAGRPEVDRRFMALSGEIEGLGGMDAIRAVMGVMREVAAGSNMTLDQMVDTTRAGLISRRDKVDMSVAMERARAERLQRATDEQAKRDSARREAEERRNADFAAFIKAYPDVQAKDIPAEVWQGVRQGQSLVAAYALYDAKSARAEATRLKAEAETARKNAENRQKAGPAARSAGNNSTGPDAFDEGWDVE